MILVFLFMNYLRNLINILVYISVHDDIDASISEGVNESN